MCWPTWSMYSRHRSLSGLSQTQVSPPVKLYTYMIWLRMFENICVRIVFFLVYTWDHLNVSINAPRPRPTSDKFDTKAKAKVAKCCPRGPHPWFRCHGVPYSVYALDDRFYYLLYCKYYSPLVETLGLLSSFRLAAGRFFVRFCLAQWWLFS